LKFISRKVAPLPPRTHQTIARSCYVVVRLPGEYHQPIFDRRDRPEQPRPSTSNGSKDRGTAPHTLDRDEVTGLRKLREVTDGPYVFISERGGPISADTVARIVTEAAEAAGIGFHVHPHMLRHSAGHMLADEGLDTRLIQDFLGHRDIRNTVRYTKLSPHRLAGVRVR
jgi:integrase